MTAILYKKFFKCKMCLYITLEEVMALPAVAQLNLTAKETRKLVAKVLATHKHNHHAIYFRCVLDDEDPVDRKQVCPEMSFPSKMSNSKLANKDKPFFCGDSRDLDTILVMQKAYWSGNCPDCTYGFHVFIPRGQLRREELPQTDEQLLNQPWMDGEESRLQTKINGVLFVPSVGAHRCGKYDPPEPVFSAIKNLIDSKKLEDIPFCPIYDQDIVTPAVPHPAHVASATASDPGTPSTVADDDMDSEVSYSESSFSPREDVEQPDPCNDAAVQFLLATDFYSGSSSSIVEDAGDFAASSSSTPSCSSWSGNPFVADVDTALPSDPIDQFLAIQPLPTTQQDNAGNFIWNEFEPARKRRKVSDQVLLESHYDEPFDTLYAMGNY
jgi:hypothetical protein